MIRRKQTDCDARSLGMKATALFCGLTILATPAVASTRAIAISIDDRSADLQALLISQQVLVPMRALFTALGADIQYDSQRRTVIARTANHRLALRVGTHGSRLVHFRTYVPLRYVAETLGAAVDYDAATRSVAIYSATGSDPASPSRAPSVSHRYPEPGERLAGGYAITATISSSDGAAPKRSGLHIFLDGADVSNAADFEGSNVSYRPQRELGYGRHDARLEWLDNDGRRQSSEWWWFQALRTSRYNVDGGYAGYGYPPYPHGINLGFRFYPSGAGTYFLGDVIQLILIAPAPGSAFVRLCGFPQTFQLNYNWAFHYYAVSLPAPSGFYLPSCAVTAYYTGRDGFQKIMTLRSGINILTKRRRTGGSPPSKRAVVPEPTKTVAPFPLKHRQPLPAVSRPPHPSM